MTAPTLSRIGALTAAHRRLHTQAVDKSGERPPRHARSAQRLRTTWRCNPPYSATGCMVCWRSLITRKSPRPEILCDAGGGVSRCLGHESIRIGERQRPQQHRFDDGEEPVLAPIPSAAS
jgi:hypothetical protein